VKLKLTLQRAAGRVDLAVTADATATVGDVARLLLEGDPAGRRVPASAPSTLRILDAAAQSGGRVLAGSATVADAGLLSGMHVEVVADVAQDHARADAGAPAVAKLIVSAGPDAGREFGLPAGATVVGRDRDAGVRLSDPMVSKRHARINVAETVEIIDLGSANGILIGDEVVQRAVLAPGDTVAIGDTVLSAVRLQQSADAGVTQIDHIRSPRVVPLYPGEEFEAPEAPSLPDAVRLPYLALAAPLIMGAVLWAITQQVLGVVMMAMSPLLLIGGFVDQKMSQRRRMKAERRVFEQSVARLRDRLESARTDERRVRQDELPTLAQLREDAVRLGPLLWTERPESATFLAVNAGSGRDRSRNRVVLAHPAASLPDCLAVLDDLADDFAHIDDVPVALALCESGSIGVTGPGAAGVARGVVYQLAARHSPSELVIGAIVPASARADWQWLSWLPHTSSAQSPVGGGMLADGRGAASRLLSRIEALVDARLDGEPGLRGVVDPAQSDEIPAPVVPAVVLVVEHDAPVDRARLTRVLERGPDAGVHVVWRAPRPEQLPAACRSFIDITAAGGRAAQVRRGETAAPVALEELDAQTAEYLARQLAPVVDVGAPDADDSDLPRSVALPGLIGAEVLDEADAVIERWTQNDSITPRDGRAPAPRKREGNLRAVFGHAGSEPFSLDLRSDGPHALVGGTTGAGKSEFLQAWVLGMAAAHSPDRVTFLFVDYKGGSAFADCVDLPHTVGLVTDLSPHMVRRALTSLRAELRHREHLLNAAGAKDLATLEKRGDPGCPPSLVIVVDEFAALVQEVPEFVDGVVDVAQRGRSLGLHLVLATQRPAGVIKDNLRANTNLRIALRMADAEDSLDILGDRMAAYFDPSVPGRGAAKTGPGRITTFQTGYAGGHTTGEPPAPRIDVEELDFGAGAVWEPPQQEAVVVRAPGPSDITRIVATVRDAASRSGIPPVRRPWLDELAPIYRFDMLPNPRTDEKLPLGVLDHPESQSQPTIFYEPDTDGNLAIFGTGGSGKSTALRTLAVAAGVTERHGGPTHVYGLDFGSRGLSMLEELPHVGAIVSGDDEERVIRMIRTLRDLVDERTARYAAVRAGTIGEYRALAGAPDEARILFLVDGIGVFKEQYEFGAANLAPWFTAFAQIAADGRGVGVHVVVAGDRPGSLPTSIASTVQRRIVLRMANEDEYLMLGVARDVLGSSSPPGRGIVSGNEVQLAILGESGNVAVQAREMQRLARSLGRSASTRPAPVRRLPEQVALADLPIGSADAPVIGLDDGTLMAASMAAKGALLLAGPPGSGRSTALATAAAAVQRANPTLPIVLLAPRRSTLAHRSWTHSAQGADRVLELAGQLIGKIESGSRVALFIEALPDFTGTEAEYELDRLVRTAVREDMLVVGEGEVSTWSQAYTLAQPFKAARRGLLLAPGEMDGDMLTGTPLGRLRRADFPPGRGFLIAGGRAAKVQIAQE
jgi:S-DNA-T family DNA segregation ATPase FtsK/SpoIIIE